MSILFSWHTVKATTPLSRSSSSTTAGPFSATSSITVFPNRIETISSRTFAAPRDTLLLASDGLSDNLHTKKIVSLIRNGPLRKVTQQLASSTKVRLTDVCYDKSSKPDDLTFSLFRLRPKG